MLEKALCRTPLYDRHVALGARMTGFAGWELPVFYSSILKEHQAVREAAGIFDVSHMGQLRVQGPEATQALQFLTCNDVAALYDGKCLYNALTNDQGGVVDDLIIYRERQDSYLLCVNASNTARDLAWILSRNKFDATVTDQSESYGLLAVQGPRARQIVAQVLGRNVLDIKPFHFVSVVFSGHSILVARTGYTGEDGFELFCPSAQTGPVWDSLLGAGADSGLVPIGLGARDSLRLEACLPLHGHELAEDISAVESGLGWIVKPEKGDFIGRQTLQSHKQQGAPRSLVGFVVDDPGIARNTDRVFLATHPEESIGYVTSGTKSPTLNQALGLALVASSCAALGTPLLMQVRERKIAGHVVRRPFYKHA